MGNPSYSVLQVKGEEGEYAVPRRFSDFVVLREILKENWPGVFIPPLPPKQQIVKTNWLS